MDNYRQALQTRPANTAIESKIEHFQFILDISDLTMFVIRDLIFIKISTPIISSIEWNIFQLYPIPTTRNQVFMAPLLGHQTYFLSRLSFINVDTEYLDKKFFFYLLEYLQSIFVENLQ